MEKTDRPRILYLDAARCAAVFLIALNHAVNRSWANFGAVAEEFHSISLPSTVVKALLTVASRYGVPLFLMITGALILRKRFETAEDVRRFYRHNWLSLLITGGAFLDKLAILLSMYAFGFIGFIDDFNKIAKRQNEDRKSVV